MSLKRKYDGIAKEFKTSSTEKRKLSEEMKQLKEKLKNVTSKYSVINISNKKNKIWKQWLQNKLKVFTTFFKPLSICDDVFTIIFDYSLVEFISTYGQDNYRVWGAVLSPEFYYDDQTNIMYYNYTNDLCVYTTTDFGIRKYYGRQTLDHGYFFGSKEKHFHIKKQTKNCNFSLVRVENYLFFNILNLFGISPPLLNNLSACTDFGYKF